MESLTFLASRRSPRGLGSSGDRREVRAVPPSVGSKMFEVYRLRNTRLPSSLLLFLSGCDLSAAGAPAVSPQLQHR